MTETFNARHGYRDMALCDSHIHISNLMPIGDTEHVLAVCARFFDLDRLAILALPHSSVSYCDDPSNNVKALYLKARLGARLGAGRVYAFGGLYHYFDARDTARGFEDQLLRVMDMGFDGLKTLMGKPPLRKRLGMPLSAPVFDGIWRRCEQKGFPVTMHLGDPGHWWRPGRDGKPAAYDETYLTLGRQREEVEKILERFPGLNLLLCHFYFIADDLEGARAFMERHQNALLDITPGGEMYYHFSQRADEWRDFFRQYQKRILFGSDTDNWAVPDTPDGYDAWFRYPFKLVKDSLESSTPFVDHDWGTLNPVNPGEEALGNIYRDNFIRRMGDPAQVDLRALNREAQTLLDTYYREYESQKGDEKRWRCDRQNVMEIAAATGKQ